MYGAPLPPISPANTALILHDMQNDFIKAAMEGPAMQGVVKRTKALIDLAHTLGMPVIYTRVENDPMVGMPPERAPYFARGGGGGTPMCLKGTPGAEVLDELAPTSSDFIVTKVRSSAFRETKMDTILRAKNRWILVVAGGSTNWGVEWLARDARVRDLMTVALSDCTYSATDEVQAASLANIDDFLGCVLDQATVVEMLTASKN